MLIAQKLSWSFSLVQFLGKYLFNMIRVSTESLLSLVNSAVSFVGNLMVVSVVAIISAFPAMFVNLISISYSPGA